MKEIKLHSRYKDVDTKCLINDEYGIIISNGNYTRIIGKLDNIEAIDFEGGPFLSKGDKIEGKEIEQIKTITGYLVKWKA